MVEFIQHDWHAEVDFRSMTPESTIQYTWLDSTNHDIASKSGVPPPGNRAYYSPPSPIQKRDSSSAPTGKSWSEASEGIITSKAGNSLDSAQRQPTFSQVVSSRTPQEEKKRIIVEIAPHMKVQRSMFRLQPRLRRQLEAHVWAYAEMLLTWELPQKRAELLECARSDLMTDPSHPALLNMLDSSPLGTFDERHPVPVLIYGCRCGPGVFELRSRQ